METYEELRTKMETIRQQMKDAAGQVIREGLRSLFDQHPQLTCVGWKQYTPYFNDGDECIFSVHTSEPEINGVDPWYADESDYENCGLSDEEVATISEDASNILNCLDKEDFRALFGDHCRVTIYRDGEAEVERYDHD